MNSFISAVHLAATQISGTDWYVKVFKINDIEDWSGVKIIEIVLNILKY